MEPIEMRKHRFPLDSDTIDRLLDGQIDPHDAPPGYAAMAALLSDAAATAPPAKEIDDALLGAMVHAIRTSPNPTIDRKPTMISKVLTAKIGVIAAGLVVSTTGAAAAASGSLPAPAQDAIAKAVSHIGVDIPTADGTHPTGDDHPSADDHPSTDDHPTGAGDNPTDADQHGTDVSGVTRDSEQSGADKGAEVSDTAKAGHGSDDSANTTDDSDAGKPTDPGSQAPVTTPNAGGTATASDASGGRSDVGTSRAPAQADAGSANADNHPTADDNPGTSHRP